MSTASTPYLNSDKENTPIRLTAAEKGKGRATFTMSSNALSEQSINTSTKKRRDRHDQSAPPSPRRRRTIETQDTQQTQGDVSDFESYDPEQPIEEQRKVSKGLRDLGKKLKENKHDLIRGETKYVLAVLDEADGLAPTIKQTSTATIDSRIIAETAEITYRKIVNQALGAAEQGVDVDEFISKCIGFMRRGGDAFMPSRLAPSSTQRPTQSRRRSQPSNPDDSDEEEGEAGGDMLNWNVLGCIALQHNARPSLSGHLLGPLSFEKRARKVTVRRAGLKLSSLTQTQPENLDHIDIQKNESTNLTKICQSMRVLLKNKTTQAQQNAEAESELRGEDMTATEQRDLFEKYALTETGDMNFWKFVLNPHDFGQTVENLFYVSFLIRDGYAGIAIDANGTMSLELTESRRDDKVATARSGARKHQMIIDIDMPSWEKIKKEFNITQSMIPNRSSVVQEPVDGRGWYS